MILFILHVKDFISLFSKKYNNLMHTMRKNSYQLLMCICMYTYKKIYILCIKHTNINLTKYMYNLKI